MMEVDFNKVEIRKKDKIDKVIKIDKIENAIKDDIDDKYMTILKVEEKPQREGEILDAVASTCSIKSSTMSSLRQCRYYSYIFTKKTRKPLSRGGHRI